MDPRTRVIYNKRKNSTFPEKGGLVPNIKLILKKENNTWLEELCSRVTTLLVSHTRSHLFENVYLSVSITPFLFAEYYWVILTDNWLIFLDFQFIHQIRYLVKVKNANEKKSKILIPDSHPRRLDVDVYLLRVLSCH